MDRRTVLKGGIVLAATAHTALASGDKVQTSPQDRIKAAMAQIEQAMSEMYPGWTVEKRDDVIHPQTLVLGKGFVDLPPNRHAVVIYAHEGRYGPEKFGWYVKHI